MMDYLNKGGGLYAPTGAWLPVGVTLGEPPQFWLPKLLGGYHLWQSKDDKQHFVGIQIRRKCMEGISFTAHVSNKKSAITSKSKLAGVA